ncbi:MAG TPA: tetratricopeptide repeat protein [Longimicrobium sp.]|nr:tetratricopeptide repeat protein [Longimicrobium sp.]
MDATLTPPAPPHVTVLEAPAGRARREWLQARVQAARARDTAAWLLACDAGRGGMWAGVDGWLREILPELEARAPDLFVRHDTELTAVLPDLRLRVRPRHIPLTETSERDEAVRHYARDRAYRIPQGLVDLADGWHQRAGGGPWMLACDDFDRRGGLAGFFFRELLRRRGATLGLTLLVAVEPGAGDAVAAELAPFASVARERLRLGAEPEEPLDPAEAARRAEELAAWVRTDTMWVGMHGHEVIRLWTAAGRPDRAAEWHARVLSLFVHLGYYEDAFRHVPALRENLACFDAPDAPYSRTRIVSNMHVAYVTTGRPQEALELVETEGLAGVTAPEDRAHLLYVAAMLHARYLPRRDLDRAEQCLREALAELERAPLEPAERHFQTGFLLNGLAFVRFRQGHADEAADLTHQNQDRLDEHLPPERHRLHRSVLLYNAGQVYAQTGDHERALRHYSAAIELDPCYSEYYNDRGNLYLRLGRAEEAERDYLRAIELSAPYPEVWFNLGRCYSRMSRHQEAERAYARAVDLDPARPAPWVNLARERQALGRPQEALAAYDAAVAVDASNPLVLANRAGLRLSLGRAEEALEDLDRAVALDPANPALERNRLLVLRALGRAPDAALEAAAA